MKRLNIKSGVFCSLSICISAASYSQPAVPLPVFKSFEPINLSQYKPPSLSNNFQQPQGPFTTGFYNSPYPMGATAADIIRQTEQNAMRVMGVQTPGMPAPDKQQQIAELEAEMKADESIASAQRFQSYLQEFLQMRPDSFSIIKAVYLTEAAYDERMPPYKEFENAVKKIAGFVKQIVKQQGQSLLNSAAVNNAIQKLYAQDNIIHNAKTGKDLLLKKLRYDFDDFDGRKDWTKMFISKLLLTGSGQCHSLPLLYLCVAEALHCKAWLSLAPNHSFIQFIDGKGRLANFETTNGHLVSLGWLMQSDAISSMAYKIGTYLDTLSRTELFAQCLADFQMNYIMKYGYDEYTHYLSQKILEYDSTNINALMTEANMAYYQFRYVCAQYGSPPREQISQYPELQALYDAAMAAQQKVNDRGYQEMPEKQYMAWLKSIDREKQKLKQ